MWRHSLSIKTGNSLWDTDDTNSHRPISVDLRPSVSNFCVAVAPQYELSISNETDGDDHVKKLRPFTYVPVLVLACLIGTNASFTPSLVVATQSGPPAAKP